MSYPLIHLRSTAAKPMDTHGFVEKEDGSDYTVYFYTDDYGLLDGNGRTVTSLRKAYKLLNGTLRLCNAVDNHGIAVA